MATFELMLYISVKLVQMYCSAETLSRSALYITCYLQSVNLDGKNACLLYAYGGFNHALQPSFSVMRLVFMSNFNGVMAIANIRGGGLVFC